MKSFVRRSCLGLAVVSASVLLVSLAGSASGATGPTPATGGPPSTPAGQDEQVVLAERLERELGDRAAGIFIDAAGELRVNVMDDTTAEQVRAAGAEPQPVAHSAQELDAALAVLDAGEAPAGLSWWVDVPSNSLAVAVPEGGSYEAESRDFLDLARSTGVPVKVERTPSPATTAALFGGNGIEGYGGGRSACTAGFVARRNSDRAQFVVTAGHCVAARSNWYQGNTLISKSVRGSYPGNDYGVIFIANPAALDPRGSVQFFGQPWDITPVPVAPPVGATVCKTGRITGTTCGLIQAKGVTVKYQDGNQVMGLIETDACVLQGDSGGPLFTGHQAVGLTSGTRGCFADGSGVSYFNPIGEALRAYELTLR